MSDDGPVLASNSSSQPIPGWEPTQPQQNVYIPWPPSPEKPARPSCSLTELEKRQERLRLIEAALRSELKSGEALLADKSYLQPKSKLAHSAPASSASTTPTAVPRATPAATKARKLNEDAHAIRLKKIEDALRNGTAPPPPPPQPVVPVSPMRPATKRASDENMQPPPPPQERPKRQQRANPFAERQVEQDAESTPKPSSSKAPTPAPVSTTDKQKKGKQPKISLSEEQKGVLKLVMQGKSVFFTGSAGTGKSVLLREIIRSLKEKYNKALEAVAVTASTGIAACNIGGTTLHSFGGFGLGQGTVEQLVKYVKRNKKTAQRWTRTKVLIIDEISMVDGELFDKVVRIARSMRKNPKAMGGIQLVVTGDFFQLPPVAKDGNMVFTFESETWNEVIEHTFNLTKVFRQKDQTFVNMLNEMRFGSLSEESIASFKGLSRDIDWGDGIEPTELYPLRANVDNSNMNRLRALPGAIVNFTATDGGALTDPQQRDKMLGNFMAPKELSLKRNCQVMLIKNTDETLVNGSMGKVVDFRTAAEHHAIVSGTTVDDAAQRLNVNKNTAKKYPLVKFSVFDALLNRTMHREMLVQPETWKVEGQNNEILVSRTQIPLILAWAMSIHKSQGQTLDRVRVDLGKVFEKGQAYVALSRATSLQGLQVFNFDPYKVMAHPRVIEWSATLSSMNDSDEE